MGVLRHGALVKGLVVLASHCLAGRVKSGARAGKAANCASTCRMALTSLHVLEVGCPVVERLAFGQLRAATRQEVGIRWISTLPSDECILINLLIASLGGALVIVLVGWAADACHTCPTQTRDRNAAVGASLDDARLPYLKL